MRAETSPFSKVTTAHLAKLAYVYMRQSSLGQVVHHRESTDMPYQLVERAIRLGWPADRVEVIDDDLGKSGASAEHRSGFQWLMSAIGLGRVGLVVSLDASRLARNNSDWYQLIELCSIVGTLIADSEQLYEPRLYHDRLILGLSGIMSEAELHNLRLRLQAGARHKAERGELQRHLPVGLDRQRDGTVILNPDEEIRARLALIFAKFTALGSARTVRTYLVQANLPIPLRPVRGPGPHETVWNPPRASAILRILHNPAYAGAYVYGQYHLDPTRRTPGRRGSGVVRLPLDRGSSTRGAFGEACIKTVLDGSHQSRPRKGVSPLANRMGVRDKVRDVQAWSSATQPMLKEANKAHCDSPHGRGDESHRIRRSAQPHKLQ